MVCRINDFAKVRKAFARPGALALAVLAGALALPQTSYADCVQQMSRMPIAAPGGAAPAYRANMLRARPAAAPARPRVMKARTTGQAAAHKVRPLRKAVAHRTVRKAQPAIRRVVVRSPAYPIPTPMPVETAKATFSSFRPV